MKNSAYFELVKLTELLESEVEQVQPTDSFSEYDHIRDGAATIEEKLETAAEVLRSIVDEEAQRRRHETDPPYVRSAGRYHRTETIPRRVP